MKEDIILDAPVRGLQQMLRTISFAADDFPSVIPDGIYGHSTEEAVREFQRRYYLNTNGIVDMDTYSRIVTVYNEALEGLKPPPSPVRYFPLSLKIAPGQGHDLLFPVQGYFAALAQRYPQFQCSRLTGINDGVTEQNIRHLQELSGLSPTGTLDKNSYNALVRLYRTLTDTDAPPSQG